MSYTEKVQAARTILEQYNSNVTDDKHKIDIESFFNKLKSSGGVTEEILGECTWEDLEDCGLPRILARSVAKVFRKPTEQPQVTYVAKEKSVYDMSSRELLNLYGETWKEGTSVEIIDRLTRISKNKPFLIFNDDGSLDTNASHGELMAINSGHASREYAINGGKRVRLYRLGDSPESYQDINPLFPNESLRPNGECSQTGRNWSSVPLNVRQLVYLARTETNEIKINSIKDAIDIINDAILDNAFDKISEYCLRASVHFEEKQKLGSLPLLRMKLNSSGSVSYYSNHNNPFATKGGK